MKRYLILENGQIFTGTAFGAQTANISELVFTTGMFAHIETLTDPSYYGQIVMQTFPLIGNYGIIPEDFEGKCCVKGYVVREHCETPSNFRSQGTLDEFLKENNIPGIYGVDTRYITKIIRESGVMNAMICDSIPPSLDDIKGFRITDAVKSVSTDQVVEISPEKKNLHVALIDYGAKKHIAEELAKRGCTVDVLPYNASAQEILDGGYDGVMLSNGPGDPAENTYQIEQISKIFGKLPIFGICLGHQLLALSQGAKTIKLKYGHRGVNQPVKEIFGTHTYITSQNHGYAVETSSIKKGAVSFVNANDQTCEGIDYTDDKAFSVQFHPEANSGPLDTMFLFDRFCDYMRGE